MDSYSTNPDVCAYALCCMWAGLHPYHPHPEVAHWTAREIIEHARQAFGEEAARDLRLTVH
jgi:hypothetical protein